MHQPTLVLIRGLPGSGKSSLAAALQHTIGADEVMVLDPDGIDFSSEAYTDHSAMLEAEGVESKFFPYRFLRTKAYQGILGGKIIIWNQAFTLLHGFRRTIDNLQAYATDHGITLPVLVVEVSVDRSVARKRLDFREAQGGHGVSSETFQRFLSDYRSFADQGYPTVSVNGEADIAKSVATVMAQLDDLR
jgi:predicted ABC-type ATPase